MEQRYFEIFPVCGRFEIQSEIFDFIEREELEWDITVRIDELKIIPHSDLMVTGLIIYSHIDKQKKQTKWKQLTRFLKEFFS
jgi:hypothetical protein